MNLIAEDVRFIKADMEHCFHCGEPNPQHIVLYDEKSFCCEGCKMVYSILDENDLCNFYELNSNAGLSQRSQNQKSFEYLDDPDAIKKLLDFANEDLAKVRFYIPQIHCSSCLWLLENLYKINPAISQSRVDFLNKELRITYQTQEITLREIVELLASIGYEPFIQMHDLEQQEHSNKVDKSLYYKLGLAGFAFGNIMLFSFPEYLGLAESGESGFNTLFSYLNLILILPVLFYSAQDYWKSAYQGLKRGHLNIDVPICLGILALFLRSVFEIVTGIGPGYLDSMAGLIFFLLIGRWFQHVTYARISFDRDFKSYFPIACNVRRDGSDVQLTLDKIQKNDIIYIKHGEMIPADGILTSGEAEIDYSFVSG
ncbi:MAG: ATPase P, partial [Saprospiraceae bacterium]|nr:ATPase P [Saprospiraceae bacterium]